MCVCVCVCVLTHGSELFGRKFYRSTVVLADGSLCVCRVGIGMKGIPQAVVAPRANSVDLLPVKWLCTRGCTFNFRQKPSMCTPTGRVLQLAERGDLTYATREQVVDAAPWDGPEDA